MHNLDRVMTQQEMYNAAAFESNEFETGYSNEYSGEYSNEYSGEFNEAEWAAELLTIGNEAELDQFFGKLFRTVSKGMSSIAKSPVGKLIGGALKQAAKPRCRHSVRLWARRFLFPALATRSAVWQAKPWPAR